MADLEENVEVTDPVVDDTPIDVPTDGDVNEYTDAEKRKYSMLRNAYQKLDNLPLSFGLPAYSDDIDDQTIEKYFRTDLADTLRETQITIEEIDDGSKDEMYFENRIVYHALKRFRLSASVFFKFSTAVDGKTIDKTNIPKILASILQEYEAEYKQWRLGHVGKIWNRSGDS